MKFLKKWLKRKKHRSKREERMETARSKGYQILQIDGQRSYGYRVVTPDGAEINNHGMGFPTSSEAYAAVVKHERNARHLALRNEEAPISN